MKRAGRHARARALGVALSGAAAGACGGSAGTAGSATVFDPAGAAASAPVDVAVAAQIERPYAPLDGPAQGAGRWVGVSVLGDGVRLSHPSRWSIRDASLEPGHAFVRYVSPEAYSFAIYERSDPPGRPWRDILAHYEADVAANGAKALGQPVPMATPTAQGRAYTIDRKIEGGEPVLSRSREILLRGEHRVVLVQIVTEEENLSRLSGELLEILRRIEVL